MTNQTADNLKGMFGGRTAGGAPPVDPGPRQTSAVGPPKSPQLVVRDGAFALKRGRMFSPMTAVGDPLHVVVLAEASRQNRILFAHPGTPEQVRGVRGPVCLSANGLVPDPGARHPKAAACNMCPMAQFGSHPRGKGPACSTRFQVAVMTLTDLNTAMRLDLPFGATREYERYRDAMKAAGMDIRNLFTTMRAVQYGNGPAWGMTFESARPMTDEEVVKAHEARNRLAVDIQSIVSLEPEQPSVQPAAQAAPGAVMPTAASASATPPPHLQAMAGAAPVMPTLNLPKQP